MVFHGSCFLFKWIQTKVPKKDWGVKPKRCRSQGVRGVREHSESQKEEEERWLKKGRSQGKQRCREGKFIKKKKNSQKSQKKVSKKWRLCLEDKGPCRTNIAAISFGSFFYIWPKFLVFLLPSILSVLIIKTSFFSKTRYHTNNHFIFYQAFDKVNIRNNLPSSIMVR